MNQTPRGLMIYFFFPVLVITRYSVYRKLRKWISVKWINQVF